MEAGWIGPNMAQRLVAAAEAAEAEAKPGRVAVAPPRERRRVLLRDSQVRMSDSMETPVELAKLRVGGERLMRKARGMMVAREERSRRRGAVGRWLGRRSFGLGDGG